MAADEINSAGGISGRRIQLIVEDDQGQPQQAAAVVMKLITQDGVHGVLGEVASSNTLAAAPIAQRSRIPMITPSSTHPLITQVGDYIFRVCFIDPFQGEVMARFARNTLRARRAAIFHDIGSEYSRGLAVTFEDHFTRLGGRIVIRQSYQQTDADFMAQLAAIRAARPDVIYVPGYYGQVGVIARQARQIRIRQPLLGGDGWDAPPIWEIGGGSLDGSYISNHFSVNDPSPLVQRFVRNYTARYNSSDNENSTTQEPDAIAALGYDSMNLLADAIRRAGTTDRMRLRDAIAQTRNFMGVTGNITINSQRNAVKPAVVLELRNRRFIYRETIQPDGNFSYRRTQMNR